MLVGIRARETVLDEICVRHIYRYRAVPVLVLHLLTADRRKRGYPGDTMDTDLPFHQQRIPCYKYKLSQTLVHPTDISCRGFGHLVSAKLSTRAANNPHNLKTRQSTGRTTAA